MKLGEEGPSQVKLTWVGGGSKEKENNPSFQTGKVSNKLCWRRKGEGGYQVPLPGCDLKYKNKYKTQNDKDANGIVMLLEMRWV